MIRIAFIIALTVLLGAAACRSSEKMSDDADVDTIGTVQYVDLEGGFYGIVGDDGTRYDPANLGGDFQEDGLRVRFRARTRENAVGIRMWGRMVEIVEIEWL